MAEEEQAAAAPPSMEEAVAADADASAGEGKRRRDAFEEGATEVEAPPAVVARVEEATEVAQVAAEPEVQTGAPEEAKKEELGEQEACAAVPEEANKSEPTEAQAPTGATAETPADAPAFPGEGQAAAANGETAQVPTQDGAPPLVPAAAAPLADNVEETIDCPSGLVGRLIGKGGETIMALQNQCGAHIQIDQETGGPDAPIKRVTISGNPHAVAAGKHLVAEVLNAPPGGAPSQYTDGSNQRLIHCPPGIVGRVIGKGGETIKGLQMQSQAHISIQQEGLGPDEPRPITITGNPAAVEYATKLVENLIQGGTLQGGPIMGPSKVLPISPDMIGRVIGRGGETIRGLQQQSGARIQLEQHTSSPTVTLSGTAQAIEYAAALIQEIFAGGNAAQIARGQAAGGYAMDPAGYGYGGGYGAGYGGYAGYNYGQYGYQQQQGAAYGAAGGAGTWQAAYDPEGRTYYFNTQTGQTQWEKPAGMP